jgi:glutaredoxin
MIKVYGKENCPRCVELKLMLEDKGMNFEYLQDMKQLRIAASKARVMMAPVVEYKGEFLGMEDFLKEVE